jgi:hypothetical protein
MRILIQVMVLKAFLRGRTGSASFVPTADVGYPYPATDNDSVMWRYSRPNHPHESIA